MKFHTSATALSADCIINGTEFYFRNLSLK